MYRIICFWWTTNAKLSIHFGSMDRGRICFNKGGSARKEYNATFSYQWFISDYFLYAFWSMDYKASRREVGRVSHCAYRLRVATVFGRRSTESHHLSVDNDRRRPSPWTYLDKLRQVRRAVARRAGLVDNPRARRAPVTRLNDWRQPQPGQITHIVVELCVNLIAASPSAPRETPASHALSDKSTARVDRKIDFDQYRTHSWRKRHGCLLSVQVDVLFRGRQKVERIGIAL